MSYNNSVVTWLKVTISTLEYSDKHDHNAVLGVIYFLHSYPYWKEYLTDKELMLLALAEGDYETF